MMYAEMTGLSEWLRVETNADCQFIPNSLCGLSQEDVDRINEKYDGPPTEDGDGDEIPPEIRDYIGGSRLTDNIELIEGYGVRSSMPGYMDCTEWSVYTTLEEAEEAFREEQYENGEIRDEDDELDDDLAKDEQED